MAKTPAYFVVEASALPEVFLKVAEAKHLLDIGEAETVHAATQAVGISRSAFYKYKDTIRTFNDMLHGRIVTFHILLKDVRGILSEVLGVFADSGANILTINQSIPVGGCATVTVTAETNSLSLSMEDVEERLRRTPGVVKCEIQAG